MRAWAVYWHMSPTPRLNWTGSAKQVTRRYMEPGHQTWHLDWPEYSERCAGRFNRWTHRGRLAAHICVSKLGHHWLSTDRRQKYYLDQWCFVDIVVNWVLKKTLFSSKKMRMKMAFVKWRSFCLSPILLVYVTTGSQKCHCSIYIKDPKSVVTVSQDIPAPGKKTPAISAWRLWKSVTHLDGLGAHFR